MDDRNKVSEHILRGANYLDSIYSSMDDNMPEKMKLELKENSIDQILNSIDTLDLNNTGLYIDYYRKMKPNNTLFMSYLRYRGDLVLLENELNNSYNSDIKQMLEDYKSKYPSL